MILCAACTANLFRPTPAGHCQHDERDAFTPLTRAQLDVPTDSLDRSPVVGPVQLAQLFVMGKRLWFDQTRGAAWRLLGRSVDHALYQLTREWGGATYDRDGVVIPTDGYAVTIRSRNASPVRVPFSDDRWGSLTEALRTEFRSPYIGVFRDDVAQTIDIDPVAIVATRLEADALGVYCGSTGGAYRFADGLGYWAPVLG